MVGECSWCGGELPLAKVWRDRRGSEFCTRSHRDESTRALAFMMASEQSYRTRLAMIRIGVFLRSCGRSLGVEHG